MYTIRETKKSYIIEKSAYSVYYGAMISGAWTGKVIVPKASVKTITDGDGIVDFVWEDAGHSVNRGSPAELFGIVANGDCWRPIGARAINCRRVA